MFKKAHLHAAGNSITASFASLQDQLGLDYRDAFRLPAITRGLEGVELPSLLMNLDAIDLRCACLLS